MAGCCDQAEAVGRRHIRNYMPEQQMDFFRHLPFIVIGAPDDSGQPWASLLIGTPGFVRAPDENCLQVDALPDRGDPLAEALHIGSHVGLLGIELATRRRNRLNGPILNLGQDGMCIAVAQSFGNCPKYIQPRTLLPQGLPITSHAIETSCSLDDLAVNQIQTADTFFIATHAPSSQTSSARGSDVSHRGGNAGFVHVASPTTLVWPDFPGNNLFNTLGNLQVNPRAGLLFPDFTSGDLLSLAGWCEVIWEGAELNGAERAVRFHVTAVRRRPQFLPWRFSPPR